MALGSISEILSAAKSDRRDFWEIILLDDCEERGVTEDESVYKMKGYWQAMLQAAESYDRDQLSFSGLAGGNGGKMRDYLASGPIAGDFMGEIIASALEMGESNACMKRIVAAPTAGACGVLPAVLIPMFKSGRAGEAEIIKALYTASGIGLVIAQRASLSGAAGGCQAEIGSASAMAAGALVALRGGDGAKIADAAAMALSNLMGLICDPIAGLVEAPCVKRNVIGAVNAVSAADMALAGIKSVVPADEVIDAMGWVGSEMSPKFRETGLGGLAATPTGLGIAAELKKKQHEKVRR